MPLTFSCPCGNRLQTDERYAGAQVGCSQCGVLLIVPDPKEIAAKRGDVVAKVAAPVPILDPAPIRRRAEAIAPAPQRPVGDTKRPAERSRRRPWRPGLLAIGLGLGALGSVGAVLFCACLNTVGLMGRVSEGEAKTQSARNLQQIGLALQDYNDANKGFPAGAIYETSKVSEGRPLLSWRVALLPFLKEKALYDQFKLDEPWDSPTNKPLLAKMPKVYAVPGRSGQTETYYRVFHMDPPGKEKHWPHEADWEPQSAFVAERPYKFAPVGGGGTPRQCLIFVVEAAESVPWTKPDELPYPITRPAETLVGGAFKDGYHVLLADGSVRFYKKGELDELQLNSAIMQNNNLGPFLPSHEEAPGTTIHHSSGK